MELKLDRRKVLFIEQEIPHYRASVLKAISQGVDADFHFFHGATHENQAFIQAVARDLPDCTSHIFVRWFFRDQLVLQNYWSALRRTDPDRCVVVLRHNPRSLLLLPFMLWCRIRGIPVVVWGQGYSRKRSFRPRRHPLDFLNLAIVRASSAYVAYTHEIQQCLADHTKKRKLFTASNTLNLSGLTELRKRLESETKTRVRLRLGLHAHNYLIFVGRLQSRKRADQFVSTLARLQNEFNMSVGGVIVGQGPEENTLRNLAAETGARDLHFTGPLSDEAAADFLFASDVLVIPGWLGLAVNHAFFFGIPVVGQKCDDTLQNHGPEAAYIIEGATGVFADARTPNSLTHAIRTVLKNHEAMGRAAREYFNSHLDVSTMVTGFRDAIDFALPPDTPSTAGDVVAGTQRQLDNCHN